MANLKTNYQNAIPATEHRKYTMINNPDGTVSLVDVTEYEQEGDLFAATDINTTNAAVNAKDNKSTFHSLTLNAVSWNGASAPFQYNLTVPGVIASNGSKQELYLPSSATPAQFEAFNFAQLADGGQTTNQITLKAYGDKPTINIPVIVEVKVL